jgi:hypothetical protein
MFYKSVGIGQLNVISRITAKIKYP